MEMGCCMTIIKLSGDFLLTPILNIILIWTSLTYILKTPDFTAALKAMSLCTHTKWLYTVSTLQIDIVLQYFHQANAFVGLICNRRGELYEAKLQIIFIVCQCMPFISSKVNPVAALRLVGWEGSSPHLPPVDGCKLSIFAWAITWLYGLVELLSKEFVQTLQMKQTVWPPGTLWTIILASTSCGKDIIV